jgi:hypothetical protein
METHMAISDPSDRIHTSEGSGDVGNAIGGVVNLLLLVGFIAAGYALYSAVRLFVSLLALPWFAASLLGATVLALTGTLAFVLHSKIPRAFGALEVVASLAGAAYCTYKFTSGPIAGAEGLTDFGISFSGTIFSFVDGLSRVRRPTK